MSGLSDARVHAIFPAGFVGSGDCLRLNGLVKSDTGKPRLDLRTGWVTSDMMGEVVEGEQLTISGRMVNSKMDVPVHRHYVLPLI